MLAPPFASRKTETIGFEEEKRHRGIAAQTNRSEAANPTYRELSVRIGRIRAMFGGLRNGFISDNIERA
jgi:hypothetical protein